MLPDDEQAELDNLTVLRARFFRCQVRVNLLARFPGILCPYARVFRVCPQCVVSTFAGL